jgi:hypothetical protein
VGYDSYTVLLYWSIPDVMKSMSCHYIPAIEGIDKWSGDRGGVIGHNGISYETCMIIISRLNVTLYNVLHGKA